MPYHTRPYRFYDLARTLCSTCLRRIDGKILFEDGRVFMDKRCPAHGPERVLLSDDVEYYRRSREAFLGPGGQPNQPGTEVRHGCPFDCGLCPQHEQHTCVGLVEVTDRCDLRCPVCYAGSGPEREGYRSLAEIEFMMDAFARSEDTLNVLQVSGGEPTLHPEFFAILDAARRRPFRHLMVNTNGVRIAGDRAFAERLATYMPNFEIYMQFDSLRAEALRTLRGADLTGVHLRALDALDALGISTTLVVTLSRGVNDGDIGDVIRFALGRPCVRGVTIQPVQAAGRCDGFDPATGRITISEVRRRIAEQSGLFRLEDVVPVPCHSESMAMAYAFKLPGGTVPLSALLQPGSLFDGAGCGPVVRDPALALKAFEAFSAGHSPSSNAASLRDLLACVSDAGAFRDLGYSSVFRVMIVQFMDAVSMDLRAVQRSCIHIVHPDGRIVPFDTFNLFHRPGREAVLQSAIRDSR